MRTLAVLPLALVSACEMSTTPSVADVEWTSFAPSIVTVDQNGRVTGLNVGVATVRARFSFDLTNEAVATVEVTPAAVTISPDVP